jgi:hypothetical protein
VCGALIAPTAFGVNITVDATALSAAERGQIALGQLVVTGDEPFTTSVDIHKPIQSGRVHFRYVPGIHSGPLTFLLEAQDSERDRQAWHLLVRNLLPTLRGRAAVRADSLPERLLYGTHLHRAVLGQESTGRLQLIE